MFAQLKELLARRPFEPFRVVMSSGTNYDVRHPEFAWLLKGGLYVGAPMPENGAADWPQEATFCSMLHISAVEPLPAIRRRK
jgi:hypothetical protein